MARKGKKEKKVKTTVRWGIYEKLPVEAAAEKMDALSRWITQNQGKILTMELAKTADPLDWGDYWPVVDASGALTGELHNAVDDAGHGALVSVWCSAGGESVVKLEESAIGAHAVIRSGVVVVGKL